MTTPTNEELLALADMLGGIDIINVYANHDVLGPNPITTATKAVRRAAVTLRAIVAKGDAVDVSQAPVSERQADLLPASERQAIRDQALEDAAQCCADEADECDEAVKWGGHRKYIQDCKAAAYAMRDRANAIRAMKGKTE